MQAKGSHSPWKAALIISHVPLFILMIIFNYLSTNSAGSNAGLYKSNTGDISDKYNTLITPAGWTFSIWAVIYIWQLIHISYSLSLLFRKAKDGDYLYVQPGHIHFSFYIVYMINNALNIGWVFIFDRELLEVSVVVLFFISFTVYICGFIICKYLNKAGQSLEQSDNSKDIWMTRIFTLNGLAVYGTWTTIASLINLAIALQYRGGVDSIACAWIALSILTLELLVWFVLETFVFDKYLRYCFSPYIVLLVALSGVISNNFDVANPAPHMIYTIILLTVSILLGIVKVCVMFIRGARSPISYNFV